MAAYAWLIPTAMGLSALVILFFGKRMPKQGAEVGIAAVALSLALSVLVAIQVFSANVGAVSLFEKTHEGGAFLVERAVQLAPIGGDFVIEAGIRVDGLVAMMFLLIAFVSLMVHVYSTGYLHGDPRYTWYFSVLSIFTASMMLLVVANNLLLLLVGWELVGVCSYLLIGFWWEEKINSNAAVKAFLTTKLGDVGLMVGVIALWAQFQTFNIGEIIASVEAGDFSQGMLTFSLLALFGGAVGKSAQFPLHTWLPDAMAGPTPVSALIHAATMVTAGVFLIARLYPVFQASATALTAVAIIGAVTLFAMGLLALVQDDVKRVLAYSTISQLGYMVAALAFSYTAGIFHLFTHGFFKALLFLGSGSLIHAVHSNNMSDMGGLRRPMPVTFWTFLIGSAALAAIPPLAGFWSKDEILVGALGGGYSGQLVLLLGLTGGLVTAFYMTRVLYLVFAGSYRGQGHPHESPPVMRWPLVALAVPAALIGFINLPFDAAHPFGFAAWTMFDLEYFEGHPAVFNPQIAGTASLLAIAGILIGGLLYRRSPSLADDPMLRLGPVTRVLERKYYLDILYEDVIVRPLRDKGGAAAYWFNDHVLDRVVNLAGAGGLALGRLLYRDVDQRVIDGAINGLGSGANFTGGLVKLVQSGNVQLYAGAMFVGVFVLGVLFAVA
ncbi:MAG: NADH-quinone oxidoreductase subunit L [Nitriliruptorales bacterium]|nr:NADH-quinone oxidoreductase subunit L [Nitriliruptorales bacterium]